MLWFLLDERGSNVGPTIININYVLTLTKKKRRLKSNFIRRGNI